MTVPYRPPPGSSGLGEILAVAAERDRLKASNAELLAALIPLAKAADIAEGMEDGTGLWQPTGYPGYSGISVGDARRARAAIAKATEKPAT